MLSPHVAGSPMSHVIHPPSSSPDANETALLRGAMLGIGSVVDLNLFIRKPPFTNKERPRQLWL